MLHGIPFSRDCRYAFVIHFKICVTHISIDRTIDHTPIRLMPVIGQFQISDIARVSYILHERWGRIVRLGGLLGRPDLLFVYDADEIEKVCVFHFIFFLSTCVFDEIGLNAI